MLKRSPYPLFLGNLHSDAINDKCSSPEFKALWKLPLSCAFTAVPAPHPQWLSAPLPALSSDFVHSTLLPRWLHPVCSLYVMKSHSPSRPHYKFLQLCEACNWTQPFSSWTPTVCTSLVIFSFVGFCVLLFYGLGRDFLMLIFINALPTSSSYAYGGSALN